MSLRLARTAMVIALVASVGLALPACKKKKPPAPPETPAPAPSPPTNPTLPNAGPTYGFNELPAPPIGPLFASGFEAPHRLASESNIRQIMLAMHQFADDNS